MTPLPTDSSNFDNMKIYQICPFSLLIVCTVQVAKTQPDQLDLDGAKATKPKISLDLTSSSPLQITLSRTSLELIKSLAEVRLTEPP